MKKWGFIFCGLYLVMAHFIATVASAASLERLDQALRLLNEGAQENCAICIEQRKQQAFGLLDEALLPGTIIAGDQRCMFVRASERSRNEMLLLCDTFSDQSLRTAAILRFHTPTERLIGVSKDDYTDGKTAVEFNSAPSGKLFNGSVVLIAYPYGDGATYNYRVKTNQLLIHCRILSLNPLN